MCFFRKPLWNFPIDMWIPLMMMEPATNRALRVLWVAQVPLSNLKIMMIMIIIIIIGHFGDDYYWSFGWLWDFATPSWYESSRMVNCCGKANLGNARILSICGASTLPYIYMMTIMVFMDGWRWRTMRPCEQNIQLCEAAVASLASPLAAQLLNRGTWQTVILNISWYWCY